MQYTPYWLGGCFQQQQLTAASLSLYTNVTRVRDYNSDPSHFLPGGINPYGRPYSLRDADCFGTVPAGSDDCQAEIDGYGNGNAAVDLPGLCSFIPCGGGELQVNQGYYWNCYQKTTQSVNLSQCRRIGKKQLSAMKMWQGRQSYTTRDQQNIPDSMEWCAECAWHNYDPNPDPNKYLRVDATVIMTQNGTGLDGAWLATSTANGSCQVDQYSGITTVTNNSASSVTTGTNLSWDASYGASNALGTLIIANSDASYLLTIYENYISLLGYNVPTVTQNSPNAYTLVWSIDGATYTLSIDMTAMTLDYSAILPLDGGGTYISATDHIQYTATTFFESKMNHMVCPDPGGPDYGITTAVINCSLSNLYSASGFYDDWLDLISNYFNIGSDITFPWDWKSSDSTNYSPLVQRNETLGSVAIGGTDTNGLLFDGSVLGQPIIISGSVVDGFWDGAFEDYQYCEDFGGSELNAYGAFGSNGVPSSATRWTNFYQQSQLPQGGYMWFNPAGQQLWGGIYAEVIIEKQSYNFCRPCGIQDRLALITGSANCIDHVSSDSSSVVLNLYASSDNISAYVPCICSIWGTDVVDGVWNVSSDSGGTLTLGNQIMSGSDMPDDLWGYATDGSTTFGNGMIAVNKWFTTTPPFCGKVDIANISNYPVTLSLQVSQQAIVNGDTVHIDGITGSAGLNGTTITLTPLGSEYNYTKFGVRGVSPTTPYTSSGYIYVQPPSYWPYNTVQPKHTYTLLTWDGITGTRDTGEYTRLQSQSASNAGSVGCDSVTPCPIGDLISNPRPYQNQWGLPQIITFCTCSQFSASWSACHPMVAAIIPLNSSQSFGYNINSHSIASPFTPDAKYGNYYYSNIVQSMPDPLGLYNAPCPCRATYDSDDELLGYSCWSSAWQWLEDALCLGVQEPVFGEDGTLITPGVDYYAHHNVYEALCYPPSGSPALPSGVYIGCLNQSQINIPTQPLGNVCSPPVLGNLEYLPWIEYIDRYNSVCMGDCRFGIYYEENGVSCDNLLLYNEEQDI